MSYSKIFLFYILTVFLAFSSCKKEEISEMMENIDDPEVKITTTNPLISQMRSGTTATDGLDLGCFSVDFPFDLISGDETIYTINNFDDFDDVLEGAGKFIDFVYPVNVTYPDGTTASIADGEALGDTFAACIPDSGWGEDLFPAFLITEFNSCYQMVYPLDLINGEGNTMTANNEDELVDLIATHYDLFFEFPFSLIDEDGNTVTADNSEELFGLLIECDEVINPGGGDPFGDCWDYTYPFNMVDQDGNIIVINNHDDICNIVLSGAVLDYVFPLTLVNGDGEELIVNNNDELGDAWADCGDWGGGEYGVDVLSFIFNSDMSDDGYECYSINYPLAYTNLVTGETNSINDVTEIEAYIDNMYGFYGEIVFPVTVTETTTGNQVTLDDIEAYYDFLYSCY